MEQNNTNRVGVIGVDTELPSCPECGGHPFRVDALFDIKDKGIKREGRLVRNERRSYYHCPCGFSTTDWHRPTYDKDGNIKVMGWMRARKAYIKKEWVKVGPCKHKNKMV